MKTVNITVNVINVLIVSLMCVLNVTSCHFMSLMSLLLKCVGNYISVLLMTLLYC